MKSNRWFDHRRRFIPTALLAILVILGPAALHCGPIYRYQKDGVWHFTDTPPADQRVAPEKIAPGDPPATRRPVLLAGYPARNAIEQAVAATVAVRSTLGFGSGFFISTEGHILTNKHVVRTTEAQAAEADAHFREGQSRIDDIERQFAQERRRLSDLEVRLEHMRAMSAAESHAGRRAALRQDYEAQRRTYQEWRADYDHRLAAFESRKAAFQDSHRDYRYSVSVADLTSSFTIILADGTEKFARLVAISGDHDLALLKLDGFRTPSLHPTRTDRPGQGDPVYAIGSPARLQNSVTSGVFSGFREGFVQTNAQIYPGNSGGPLVTQSGRVLGVNTFKTLTRKFEGLGFAIPIETALGEFGRHLPRQ